MKLEMKFRSLISRMLSTSRLLVSLSMGIVASWLIRNPLASLFLYGKDFAGRNLALQIAILLTGVVIASFTFDFIFSINYIYSITGKMFKNLDDSIRTRSLYLYYSLKENARRKVLSALISLLAFLLLITLWFILIQHNWQRVEIICWPEAATDSHFEKTFDNVNPECLTGTFIGADTIEYWHFFKGYPQGFINYWNYIHGKTRGSTKLSLIDTYRLVVDSVGGEFWKRPLDGPLSATINIILFEAAGIKFPESMYLILAFYASLCSFLLFYLLKLTGLRSSSSVLLTGIVTISFGWLPIFSIPESYSLSAVGLMMGMISGYKLSTTTSKITWPRILLHSFITGIAAWLYPPNAGLLLFLLQRDRKAKQQFWVLFASISLVCFIFILPQLTYYGFGYFHTLMKHVQQFTSMNNFTNVVNWINVLVGFLFFSIISPVNDFMHASAGINWQAFLSRPGAVLAICCLSALYIIVLIYRIRLPAKKGLFAPSFFLFLLLLWNIYFDPHEVLLFLSIPLGVLALLAGCAIRDIEITKSRNVVVSVVLLITFITLLATNWLPVFG